MSRPSLSSTKKNRTQNVTDSADSAAEKASFEVINVLFHSITNDTFRVKVRHERKEIVIWIESKKTRKQYEVTINDITENGLIGIPESAVVLFIQKALESCVSHKDDLVKSPRSKSVTRNRKRNADELLNESSSACDSNGIGSNIDLQVHQDKAVLSMLIDFGGMWRQECMFELRSVPLEPVDILSAQLRDAQDEIASLKQAMMQIQQEKPKGASFAVLEGRWSSQSGHSCKWEEVKGSDTSLVTVSKDGTGITVNKAGWYQVTVSCVLPAQSRSSYPGTPGYSLVISSSAKTFMEDLTVTKPLQVGTKFVLTVTQHVARYFSVAGANIGSECTPTIIFSCIAELDL